MGAETMDKLGSRVPTILMCDSNVHVGNVREREEEDKEEGDGSGVREYWTSRNCRR